MMDDGMVTKCMPVRQQCLSLHIFSGKCVNKEIDYNTCHYNTH